MKWFEDEEFWSSVYPFMFPDSRMERAEDGADAIMGITGISDGDVLDLCCGPGRFSIAMARRGFSVTGVDRTEYLLRMASERAALEGMDIEWVPEDMLHFLRPCSFDLVLSMFTSFGYFDSHDDNMKVLCNIHDSLRPGGQLVLEIMGKENLAAIFLDASTDELEDGSLLIQKHRVEDGWRKIHNDWMIVDGLEVRGRWQLSHWIYSAMELESMLLEAGFDFISAFGGLDRSPYDDSARRLLIVAARGE